MSTNSEFDEDMFKMPPQKRNEQGINYCVKANEEYQINAQEFGGKRFYKIPIQISNIDGTLKEVEKLVQFKKDVFIENGTIIKITSGREDFYYKKGDRFNPIWYLRINEFEIVSKSVEQVKQAMEQFNAIDDNDDLPW